MYKLIELNLNMDKDVYDMYQDIPFKESGSTNECYGLLYEDFKDYLKKEINRKYNKITLKDTPTITYIMYVDDYPVGIICLRTSIDSNWLKWSGNFYYKIRSSERNKGYGTMMLHLLLDEAKKYNFNVLYGQSSKGNISSSKVILNNGGILINELDGTRYYKINII